MSSLRFRPRLDEVESRVTPSASPADVAGAVQQIRSDAQMTDFIVGSNAVALPQYHAAVPGALTFLHQQDLAAAGTLVDFYGELNAFRAANPSAAGALAPFYPTLFNAFGSAMSDLGKIESYAGKHGLSLAPPVQTPTPPPAVVAPPIDAGMSDVFPDTSGADFHDLGDGVRIKDVIVGSGTPVANGSKIVALYTLFDSNGQILQRQHDLATAQAHPFAIPDGVIKGFGEGVIGLQPGGIRQIFVPSALAYNNGDLTFDVKLISYA